jgi:hypothetical protein
VCYRLDSHLDALEYVRDLGGRLSDVLDDELVGLLHALHLRVREGGRLGELETLDGGTLDVGEVLLHLQFGPLGDLVGDLQRSVGGGRGGTRTLSR